MWGVILGCVGCDLGVCGMHVILVCVGCDFGVWDVILVCGGCDFCRGGLSVEVAFL